MRKISIIIWQESVEKAEQERSAKVPPERLSTKWDKLEPTAKSNENVNGRQENSPEKEATTHRKTDVQPTKQTASSEKEAMTQQQSDVELTKDTGGRKNVESQSDEQQATSNKERTRSIHQKLQPGYANVIGELAKRQSKSQPRPQTTSPPRSFSTTEIRSRKAKSVIETVKFDGDLELEREPRLRSATMDRFVDMRVC